ncbi:hypothetical protein BLA24_04430 [Streptomyces cinnamoneus]|uniref:Pyridoxamine 5'-phosphate oxidase N-terminal domain-containing protein n=1 Tax=Streptomyces cinnamoneus TaxID=53446 RepID=A0A2G1XP32_STRCJ|nr:hypothetical protein BLA24_04430 [Streptomyces cinnamoneus]
MATTPTTTAEPPDTAAPGRSPDAARPGSAGEHLVQRRLGTADRAGRFYDDQVLSHLNARMREFVARQEMFFLATADRRGTCDNTFRAGPPGFLRVLDDRTLAYPEYRGNGVLASLGNIEENPHVGILLIDFCRDRIGLHVNGSARLVDDADLRSAHPALPRDEAPGRRAVVWVEVTVEEAYVHCASTSAPAEARTRPGGTAGAGRLGAAAGGGARSSPPPAAPPAVRPRPARRRRCAENRSCACSSVPRPAVPPVLRGLPQVRDVLGAVDVRLLDRHLHPHHRRRPGASSRGSAGCADLRSASSTSRALPLTCKPIRSRQKSISRIPTCGFSSMFPGWPGRRCPGTRGRRAYGRPAP